MFTTVINKIQTVFHHQEMQKTLGWMDTIPAMDALDVLKETRQQLAKIQFETFSQAKRQIEFILEIDKNTYRQAKKTNYKYLTILKINKKLESDIHNSAYLYHRQLFVAYKQFFDLYESQNKEFLSVEKINLILCRYLNATFAMAKWRYFDDQPAPVGTWESVHKVIKFAEKLAIMNKNLFLYSYQNKETSIATLLKQGFMMDTLHKGNYSRLQIQLTEQVLRYWATNPLILNKYKQDKVQFFINLEGDKGPERIRAVEKFADYRFWKTTRLIDKIEAYLCAVDTQKPLTEFGLEKIAPATVIVKLFKKLRAEWCVEGYERQRRSEARNKHSKLLNVSYGLEDICSRLETIKAKQASEKLAEETADDDATNFDVQMALNRRNKIPSQARYNSLGSENWWMVDESTNGFAVDLGKEVSSWVETGKLVGYTSPDDKDLFVIAEIKNLRKQANGTYRVGLEVLSTQSTAVQVARVDQSMKSAALSGYFVNDSEMNFAQMYSFAGILLTNKDNKLNKYSIILPRNEYKRGNEYRINIEGEDKLIMVGAPLIKQREWIRVAVPA